MDEVLLGAVEGVSGRTQKVVPWAVAMLSDEPSSSGVGNMRPSGFLPAFCLLQFTRSTEPDVKESAVIRNAEILGGEPVFRGSRVPFKILIEYLEGGETLDQFLEQYPTVSRELAIAALEEARSSLISQLK